MNDENQIIEDGFQYIKDLFSKDFSGHDYHHSIRVYNNACHIAQTEGGNLFIIKLAALLHDVDDRKLFDTSETLANARAFLESHQVDSNTIEQICTIIKSISYSGNGSKSPDSLEGKIVQDADRLDALGAIGIARTFAYGGHKGRPLYVPDEKPIEDMTTEEYQNHTSNSINHFYEKLLKLKDLMNTKTAIQIAEQRHQYMESFLDQFFGEWEGCR